MEIAGTKLEQKQWESLISHYNLDKIDKINRARFLDKLHSKSNEFLEILQFIKNKQKRVYSRPSLLYKIDAFYRQLFYICRVPIPPTNQQTESEILFHLSYENPVEVFDIYTSFKNKIYMIYYLRTPLLVSGNRNYPANKILRVVFHKDTIIDIQENEIFTF